MARGRPRTIGAKEAVVSMRFDHEAYERIKEIASLESVYSGKNVTAAELIRQACNFVFEDNERLRESFRRARTHLHKKAY
jgi:hypothetical protein